MRFSIATCCGFIVSVMAAAAEPVPLNQQYLQFVRGLAAQTHSHDSVPTSLAAWREQATALRRDLLASWGGFPTEPCPLQAQKLGELQRPGYRVEKIVFQTLPGVLMTANAYVPDGAQKVPAVLCVHGHWRGAKQDPTVQARCVGLVRHGFFVLVVDAFGAGERAIGEALGEYHGEMTGATLLPIGQPLSGMQVYENMRAVDYLRSRPEVDGERIGVTGASGGGNQSMYAGAWDTRLGAVVPVCSVGNYQAYLGAACCMCEVVPGAVGYTEEWGVLSLCAPRGLMVVNATLDAPQFSVEEARKSVQLAEQVFHLHDAADRLKHATFESPHDYNQAMREAMYGWMKKHLAGQGDGSPLPEPELKLEDPETLRCYPGTSRPDDFVTIPRYAAQEGRRLLASRPQPKSLDESRSQAQATRAVLRDRVLGGIPTATPLNLQVMEEPADTRQLRFQPESGLDLEAKRTGTDRSRLAILLDLEGGESAEKQPLAAVLREAGWGVLTLDLRATGKRAQPGDKIGRAPDHNTAEWALWLGRPLLGQWVVDVCRTLDAVREAEGELPQQIAVVGIGPAGLVAACAAALDDRIHQVAVVGTLSSYITEVPYEGQRLGILAPGIVRDVGDVQHVISLAAPRRMVIAGAVAPNGMPLSAPELTAAFADATATWNLDQASDQLRLLPSAGDAAAIAKALE